MSWFPFALGFATYAFLFRPKKRIAYVAPIKSPIKPPKGVRCSPPLDSDHPLTYVSKEGESYGSIARAITGSTSLQIDLASANPEVKLDFQFASTDHPGTVIHSETADPVLQQDGGTAPFLGAFPPPGTPLKLPTTWNGWVFFAEDGKTWHSDGDGVVYPTCGLPDLPAPPDGLPDPDLTQGA